MTDAESFFKHLFTQKGFKPDHYDEADIPYKPKSGTHIKDSENLRENLAYHDHWTGIYDQGKLNSCVANAAAALYAYEFRKASAFTKGELPAINPSRTFIWYNARESEILAKKNHAVKEDVVAKEDNIVKEKAENATCYTRSAMKSLHQRGVCDELKWPYPTQSGKQDALDAANMQPTSAVIEDASHYRIWGYERVDIKRSHEEKKKLEEKNEPNGAKWKDDDGKLVKDKLRAAISEGHPVQFGMHYYQPTLDAQFTQISTTKGKKWSLTELPSRHQKPPHHRGSHAVLAIGYDENSVICQNSYGLKFDYDDQGFFLVPWGWITDYEATEDFWMIRVHEEVADS